MMNTGIYHIPGKYTIYQVDIRAEGKLLGDGVEFSGNFQPMKIGLFYFIFHINI